ncbi:trafficking protein particle complex subunit 5-like [Penaeus japonicus]|uniref:trafficking protein particle complex subunit 5-like n=1 Tax=Penaeus japonicus TaxID=27405 RepID=UPI001C71554F|nr:trafficking protein particle complex subunit 5-like [Penaeus japonicus]XP_042863050.1 trafficking protein particle complex subunit 5-like [Penaeus japonicus]
MSSGKQRPSILDKSLSRGKSEVSLTAYALMFSEMVQYSHNRVTSVNELHNKLSELGQSVGVRMVELLFVRDRNYKRETKLLNILLFVKGTLWKSLFGKEADKLDRATDDERIYYLIEKEPLVNRFISVPRDKSSINCAAFIAGIIEAVLNSTGFPAKVTALWHKGTTFMIKFDDAVLTRDKQLEGR